MVFFVKSAVKHTEIREIVRKTWGSLSFVNGTQFATIFILGRTKKPEVQTLIDEEHARYGDILQLDTADEYRQVRPCWGFGGPGLIFGGAAMLCCRFDFNVSRRLFIFGGQS